MFVIDLKILTSYINNTSKYIVEPVAAANLGTLSSPAVVVFLSDLGTSYWYNYSETVILFQMISVAIQHFKCHS
jgi:hypothetical protein